MATHSSILAWEIPWSEKPGGLQSMGSQKKSDMTQRLKNNKMSGIVFAKIQLMIHFILLCWWAEIQVNDTQNFCLIFFKNRDLIHI